MLFYDTAYLYIIPTAYCQLLLMDFKVLPQNFVKLQPLLTISHSKNHLIDFASKWLLFPSLIMKNRRLEHKEHKERTYL